MCVTNARRDLGSNDEKKHGLHSHCFHDWFELNANEEDDFKSIALKHHETAEEHHNEINTSSFFQGKFKKYSASLKGKNYILKVQEEKYPELPACEYMCNQLAKALKIPVPDHYLIDFYSVNTFVVRNFMDDVNGNLIHIYHYFNDFKDLREFNCQNILKILEEKTKRIKNIYQFIEMCLFDALIGNHDRHGRNIGLIQTSSGQVLAPIYDNPSYLAIEDDFLLEANHEPTGGIATQNNINPVMKDYMIEFKRLGFVDSVQKFQKSVKIDHLLSIVDSSWISFKRKIAFKKLMTRRFREMQDELSK